MEHKNYQRKRTKEKIINHRKQKKMSDDPLTMAAQTLALATMSIACRWCEEDVDESAQTPTYLPGNQLNQSKLALADADDFEDMIKDAVTRGMDSWVRRRTRSTEDIVCEIWDRHGPIEAGLPEHDEMQPLSVPTLGSEDSEGIEDCDNGSFRTSDMASSTLSLHPESSVTFTLQDQDTTNRVIPAQMPKTLEELITEANEVDWRERARKRLRVQAEAQERVQKTLRKSRSDGDIMTKVFSSGTAAQKLTRLADNSWVVDYGHSALQYKLSAITGDSRYVEEDNEGERIPSKSVMEDDISVVVPVAEDPSVIAECPNILSNELISQLVVKALPFSLSSSRWKRLYSLARDGDSFDNFLNLAGDVSQSMLVVRTSCGEIFGAYSDNPLRPLKHTIVSARTCLWKVSPQVVGGTKDGNITVYKWTGVDRHIQSVHVRSKRITFGNGGDATDSFGLCIQEDFQRGSTAPCGTFGNEPLCDQGHFNIVDLECWAFLNDFC